MTSSNGNIFRVTDPLWGEFTGHGKFPSQRPVTRSLDVFFDLRQNKRFEQTKETLVIWDAIAALIMTSIWWEWRATLKSAFSHQIYWYCITFYILYLIIGTEDTFQGANMFHVIPHPPGMCTNPF